MSKTLTIKHRGETFTLEYTRRSVKAMEDSGFVAAKVKDYPMMLLDLFAGAFFSNHPRVKRQKIEQIYDSLPGKDALLEKLVEMYNEPVAALMEDPEENEGNATWTASW